MSIAWQAPGGPARCPPEPYAKLCFLPSVFLLHQHQFLIPTAVPSAALKNALFCLLKLILFALVCIGPLLLSARKMSEKHHGK